MLKSKKCKIMIIMMIETCMMQTMVKMTPGFVIRHSNQLNKLNHIGDNINKLKKTHMAGVSGKLTLGLNMKLLMGMKMFMIQVVKISQLSPCCRTCMFSNKSIMKRKLVGVLLSKKLKRSDTIWFRSIWLHRINPLIPFKPMLQINLPTFIEMWKATMVLPLSVSTTSYMIKMRIIIITHSFIERCMIFFIISMAMMAMVGIEVWDHNLGKETNTIGVVETKSSCLWEMDFISFCMFHFIFTFSNFLLSFSLQWFSSSLVWII